MFLEVKENPDSKVQKCPVGRRRRRRMMTGTNSVLGERKHPWNAAEFAVWAATEKSGLTANTSSSSSAGSYLLERPNYLRRRRKLSVTENEPQLLHKMTSCYLWIFQREAEEGDDNSKNGKNAASRLLWSKKEEA